MKHAKSAWHFKNRPDVNEFHWTSDGQHFIKIADAIGHAKNLASDGKSDVVETVTRGEMLSAESEPTGQAGETSSTEAAVESRMPVDDEQSEAVGAPTAAAAAPAKGKGKKGK